MTAEKHRDFLAIPDYSKDELLALFDLAERMRNGTYTDKPLAGKSLAMIFMKSSTRTRVSFEVGTWQLGGHALFLSPRDVQLGRGEPVADTARVLSRYVDGIMIRTYSHAEVQELAKSATVPVINGLTDLLHPCQILADVLTIRQHLGGIDGKKVAWIGDGNNMANSWINAAYRLGFDLTLACPEGYEPDAGILERAQSVAQSKANFGQAQPEWEPGSADAHARYAAIAPRANSHCDQISLNALTSRSMSPSEWTGEGVSRNRSVPTGTVG